MARPAGFEPATPRLRRPCVGSVINRRLSPTSPRWSGSREFTPILAELRRFIASHAITDRRDDHVNVARPHPEPAMRSPCSLGRVPTSVTTSSASCARPPAIIEDLHTIADLRDPDQIRRDSDAGATRWPRGGQGWVDSTPRVRERSHEAGARTDIWSGRPGSFLTLAPGRRRRSPASGSHRTERADFPHSALRKLIHSTASACSSRCGRRKRGRCNGCLAFIW